MKAMPLLLPGHYTMRIPEDFNTILTINTIATMKMNINSMKYFSHWARISGGHMMNLDQ